RAIFCQRCCMTLLQSQSQGWRFAFPLPGQTTGPLGLELNRRGGVAMIAGPQVVRQSILMLLATRPGERVGRPSYGCDLYRLVFEPNDQTAGGLAIHYVRNAITRWEPRVRLTKVDAGAPPEAPARLVIEIAYLRRDLSMADMLTYTLDLS